MPRKATEVPKFKSESEEADWLASPQARRRTQREFARALKDGSLIHTAGSKITKTDPRVLEQLMEAAKRSATRSISIRVPIADLEQARRIAERAGVGYQTVLKRAIREGLRRAG